APGHLTVPVAELRPGEVVDRSRRVAESVRLQVRRQVAGRGGQTGQDPAVLERQVLHAQGAGGVTFEVQQEEAGGVPQLVGKRLAHVEAVRRLLRGGQLRVVGRPRAAGAE